MKRLFTFFFALLLTGGLFAQQTVQLSHLSEYATGIFDDGAAEITTFDPVSKRLFFVNASTRTVDILNLASPASPTAYGTIDLTPYGKAANSVAFHDGVLAVAVEDTNKQAPGRAVFFDADGTFIAQVTVGALPDMITFSPDGSMVLTANEGEPSDDYLVDPDGSVSIIDISGGVASLQQSDVTTLDFSGFTLGSLDASVRIFGDDGNATVAQDMEPEYIAVSPDSKTAYVVCQENNAMAIVDLSSLSITDVVGLGFKDHSLSGNGFDASDRSNLINITTHPVMGMYMPDAAKAFSAGGNTYIITANEGDSRDYGGYSEEVRVKDLTLDAMAFPNAADLQLDTIIGRLKTTIATGDTDNDGDHDVIFSYGARSFSIWDATGTLVYDSGDELEQVIAAEIPAYFNSNNDDNDSYKSRSDDKGPEPEAVEVAEIGGYTYAFVGMERVGGIFLFDISTPAAPVFVQYINNRNWSVPADSSAAGDLGVEDIKFVSGANSPDGQPLIIASNEVSGNVSIYRVSVLVSTEEPAPAEAAFRVYPNPTQDHLYFNRPMAVRLYDMQGRLIMRTAVQQELHLGNLPAGAYNLRTEDGQNIRIVVGR